LGGSHAEAKLHLNGSHDEKVDDHEHDLGGAMVEKERDRARERERE
jgi:hypothetical protein